MKRLVIALALSAVFVATNSGVFASHVWTFQQGDPNGYAGCEDTKISLRWSGSDPGSYNEWIFNYGGESTMSAYGSWGWRLQKAFIKFQDVFGPGPNQIPYGAQIVSATMKIWVYNFREPGSWSASPLLVDLDYGTGTETFAGAGEVHARDKAGPYNAPQAEWAVPANLGPTDGIEYDSSKATSESVWPNDPRWAEWDVTETVQDGSDGIAECLTDYGMIIEAFPGSGISPGGDFYSCDIGGGSEHLRPILEVEWFIPDPELAVGPDSQSVGSGAGQTTFAVSNVGGKTMNWTATVDPCDSSWLSVTAGSPGVNDGSITVDCTENTSGLERTGTIEIAAPGTTGSPRDVYVVQGAFATDATSTSTFRYGVNAYDSVEDSKIALKYNGTDAGSDDWWIKNYGASPAIRVSGIWGDVGSQFHRAFIKFPAVIGSAANQVPAEATILTATLRMNMYEVTEYGTFELYPLLVDLSFGDKVEDYATGPEIMAKFKKGPYNAPLENWANPDPNSYGPSDGLEYDSTAASATSTIIQPTGWKSWDVTAAVQDGSLTGYGMMLEAQPGNGTQPGGYFWMSESPDPTLRPQLVIQWKLGTIPGDADENGCVDELDLATVDTNWQTLSGATWTMGDFNGDEAVTLIDLSILNAHWMQGCP